MNGLGDDEWSWRPIPQDGRITIRWRLDHIAEAVGGQRNWEWLGVSADEAPKLYPADSAQTAVANVAMVVDRFSELISGPDSDLDQLIGPVAGPYAEDPRSGLVLHTLDELIHHAAEAALLRDLYDARSAD
jgi:hypothetical protein